MKTPEQMAVEWLKEEYGDTSNWTYMGQEMSLDAFYAGYQAAVNSPEKPDSCEHILDMEKMVDVNPSSGWISVKDRLPEDGVEVLVVSDGETGASWHEAGEFGWAIGGTVTHWAPLPKPPEE